MGTTTTNLGLYKPAVGETGWGTLVDGNFDTLDTYLHSLNSAVMYAHPGGSNSNDGLSWATAKKDILGAYDALPSDGGDIRFADSTYVDSVNTDRGLWLVGNGDPSYSSPPTGWRQSKHLRLIGRGTRNHGSSTHEPQALIRGGSSSDRNKPTIWMAGQVQPTVIDSVRIQYPAIAVRLGIDSTGTTITAETAGVAFRNVSWGIDRTVGNGPGMEWGYVYWLYFKDCGFEGNPASSTITACSITSGTTARFTVGTHYMKAGDTVYVSGVTPSGYNGTWTVTAVAATTFDANIGTSPAAGSVFGTALPLRSYRRAAIGFDRVEQLPTGVGSGLIYFTDCNFNGGHIHFAPYTGSWGNLSLTNATYEGAFGNIPQPPLVHVRASYGAGTLPTGGGNIVLNNIEMADGAFNDGCVVVDGPNSPHDIVTLTGGSITSLSGNLTVLNGLQPTRTMSGFRGRYALTGKAPFEPLLLAQHDGGRRMFAPAAVRFTNRADQDTANWGAKSGSGTVTTGVTAPDGTTGAATITSGSNGGRQVARFTITPAVGDWLVGGVWRRQVSGASDDSNSPSLSVTGGTLARSLTADMVAFGPRFEDGGWEWCATGSKFATVTGGALDAIWQLGFSASAVVAYYAPVCFYIPAASIVDDDEMYDFVRHLAPVSDTASAGQLSMLRSQSLHIPKGYVEFGEMTAPSAGATDYGRLYMEDNGSGKTRLVVKFATGAAQVIATQP